MKSIRNSIIKCVECNTELKPVYKNGGTLAFCPNDLCSKYLTQINTAYRSELERQQFLKEQDGWTEFKIEIVTMFGFPVVMSECTKCKNIVPLYNLFRCLSPLHCTGCGRITLEQDRVMYENYLKQIKEEKQ